MKKSMEKKSMEKIQKIIKRIEFFEGRCGSPQSSECYGMGKALKNYLNIPEFIPINVEMDHGVPLDDNPNQCQLKTKLPIFVTRRNQKTELLKYSKQSYVMGSPFVHYRTLHNIHVLPDAEGTVCFPVHSTHLIDVIFDWEVYAEQLLLLPPYLHPITVCMYWKDLLENRHKHFFNKNISIVTAGHMADPEFTRNFYQILRQHKYSTSNLVSSCTFYSVEMNIPFFLYGTEPSFNNHGSDHNRPMGYFEGKRSDLDRVFDFTLTNNSEIHLSLEAKSLCLQKLGLNENINKNALRKTIVTSAIVWTINKLVTRFKCRLTVLIKHINILKIMVGNYFRHS